MSSARAAQTASSGMLVAWAATRSRQREIKIRFRYPRSWSTRHPQTALIDYLSIATSHLSGAISAKPSRNDSIYHAPGHESANEVLANMVCGKPRSIRLASSSVFSCCAESERSRLVRLSLSCESCASFFAEPYPQSSPKVMVPRQISDTRNPEFPSSLYFIGSVKLRFSSRRV
jgi:hypothetical protein